MKVLQGRVGWYVAVIFLSGALLGVFGHRLYEVSSANAAGPAPTAANTRVKYMSEMQTRLNLNENQLSQLNRIMDETRDRMQDFKKRVVEPENARIRSEQVEKIRTILTPQQLTEYEKLRQERAERPKKNGQ